MGFFHKFGVAFRGRVLLAFTASIVVVNGAAAQKIIPPSTSGPASVRLEADQQRKEGDIYFADGNVEIQYKNLRLRADHVQYNTKTYEATAHGHVLFDVDTQHLTADSAEFNVQSGAGLFEHARGEVTMEHKPNATLLVSPNPLVFEAREVRRLDARTYSIEHAWLTVCEPDKPSWKFVTSHATLEVDRTVAMVNSDFQMFRIPLLYFPYASLPAGRNLRKSGMMIPEIADTSVKGFVFGDGYYWAPRDWADLTLGAAYLSRRGWQQNGELRAKPWENVSISAKYFGVIDRGLPVALLNAQGKPVLDSAGNPETVLEKQGGHSDQFKLDAQLRGGWRAVADANQLTSLIFQLAFAPTFGEAVNSEVRNTGFLTNNFRGFSVDFAATSYKNFVNAQPQVVEDVRAAPEARFSSVDQAPWKNLPIYFGGDAFAGAVHRNDEDLVTNSTTGVETVVPGIVTPTFVERSEIAPRVVVPLHWGPWLGVTTSFTARATSYSSQLVAGSVVNSPVGRTTGEVNVDLKPPTLERVWQTASGKWKHTIDPEIEYNYVGGVGQFDRFVLFDEDETLTDTNDFVYSITQRLFHRSGNGQANDLVSWKIEQAYYFDPTFGGALVPGTRNVFQALDSITPFAFADEPRHFSPINSDLILSPGARYDAEIRLDYDTVRHRITTSEALLKIRPTENFNFTVAQFSVDNFSVPAPTSDVLQPVANQVRAQLGYGQSNRRGWNTQAGVGYDVKQNVLQNEFVEISYNGSCCGFSIEYRRLSLGEIRTENQYRFSLNIANIGTFGNLRREEKVF
ncbi:MAG TPA: LPS assembly protein LptD [Candidatus Acidoferrales bacterium]|jgi:LPS-assembly protein|nr:LPS assembly protein LptD [Candidatus Acidoferrales bacterium]